MKPILWPMIQTLVYLKCKPQATWQSDMAQTPNKWGWMASQQFDVLTHRGRTSFIVPLFCKFIMGLAVWLPKMLTLSIKYLADMIFLLRVPKLFLQREEWNSESSLIETLCEQNPRLYACLRLFPLSVFINKLIRLWGLRAVIQTPALRRGFTAINHVIRTSVENQTNTYKTPIPELSELASLLNSAAQRWQQHKP